MRPQSWRMLKAPMRELPSRGRCHAAFLLAHSARLNTLATVDAWIASASQRATIMAAATDVAGTAAMLLSAQLATLDGQLHLDARLSRCSIKADRTALTGIAALFLQKYPPGWIAFAVVNGKFLPETVPRLDLNRLAWLEDDLERIVIEAYRSISTVPESELRKAIGTAGELAVIASLRSAGHDPTHVALISDAYGYDVEYTVRGAVNRLEVKSCVQAGADRVIVSRNEFEKASLYGASWRLIQVTFSSAIVVNRAVAAADILAFRELPGKALLSLAPPENRDFCWLESAEFRPPEAAWVNSELHASADFSASLSPLPANHQH
jgi:Domain of unknown function (DUF3883)